MPPKSSLTDDLIKALKDDSVLQAIGSIFDVKVSELMRSIDELKQVNTRQSGHITKIQQELKVANMKIENLDKLSRKENLVISGLLPASAAEASTASSTYTEAENNRATEQLVLRLFNDKLRVPVKADDISIAHRLKKIPGQPTPIMVRFTNRKVRDDIFRARKLLKNHQPKVYVNEDLSSQTAELYKEARRRVKTKDLQSCWTTGGVLHVKIDLNDKATRVLSANDFPH